MSADSLEASISSRSVARESRDRATRKPLDLSGVAGEAAPASGPASSHQLPHPSTPPQNQPGPCVRWLALKTAGFLQQADKAGDLEFSVSTPEGGRGIELPVGNGADGVAEFPTDVTGVIGPARRHVSIGPG